MKVKTRVKNLSKEFGLGDNLKIDSSLTTGQPLVVEQIWEWSPPSLNQMVDYVLADNAGDGSLMRLRIMRQDNGDRSKAAILTLYDRFPYSEQFHDVVRSDFKHLAVHDSPSENGEARRDRVGGVDPKADYALGFMLCGVRDDDAEAI